MTPTQRAHAPQPISRRRRVRRATDEGAAAPQPVTEHQAELLQQTAANTHSSSDQSRQLAHGLAGQLSNRQLQQLLGGQSATATHGALARQPVSAAPSDQATAAEEQARAAFLTQTFRKENHHPATGAGLFDAHYQPASGQLTISVKVHFDFQAGNPADPDWQAAHAGETFQPEEFQWQGDEAEQWKSQAMSDMQSTWSQQYAFGCTRPGWETLPTVNVNVQVIEAAKDKAHYVTQVNKWPRDDGPRDAVTPPTKTKHQSKAHFEESSHEGITNPDSDTYHTAPDKEPTYKAVKDKNPGQIHFPVGQTAVPADDQRKLREFGEALADPQIPPFPVTVVGHASSDGGADHNQVLSADRARNVSNELVSAGVKTQPTALGKGEAAAGPGPQWRRADITLSPFVSSQKTVAHEFGHMLGLRDEYAESGRREVGDPTGHSQLVKDLMPEQQPVLATDNDNIMSTGNTVRPHHYVTFLEVLGEMTAMAGQWKVGPAKQAPANPGVAPSPDAPRTA